MSEQLTLLGRRLSDLNIEIEVPDIPLLEIKGGKIDLQRFILEFSKVFWNEDLGLNTSISTNYDWYAPANAERHTLQEFLKMIEDSSLENSFIHSEEACHSGRFKKK